MSIHNQASNPVSEKMRVLRQFSALKGCTQKEKHQVQTILANCKSEFEMERKVYNLLRGLETPKQFIKKYMPSTREN